MAEINEKQTLELERQRQRLQTILTEKGITVEDDATLGEMIPLVDDLSSAATQENYLAGYLNGSVTEVVNANTTTLRPYAFYASSQTTKISLPNVTGLGAGTFDKCLSLRHINLPSVSIIEGNGIFQSCMSAKIIYLPNLTTMRGTIQYTFKADGYTMSLEKLMMPRYANEINYFNQNIIDLPSLKLFEIASSDRVRINSAILETLILRSTSMAALSSASDLKGGSPTGLKIYVPSNLIATYKADSKWATFEDCFESLEGSDYEDVDWYASTDEYRTEVLGE